MQDRSPGPRLCPCPQKGHLPCQRLTCLDAGADGGQHGLDAPSQHWGSLWSLEAGATEPTLSTRAGERRPCAGRGHGVAKPGRWAVGRTGRARASEAELMVCSGRTGHLRTHRARMPRLWPPTHTAGRAPRLAAPWCSLTQWVQVNLSQRPVEGGLGEAGSHGKV